MRAKTLSSAEEWQCAQAWAAWEDIQKGTVRDVPMEEFRALTEQVLARMAEAVRAKPRKRPRRGKLRT